MMKILTALPKIRMLNCLWAILFTFFLSPDAGAQTFTHPGIPLSGSDLSILKAHIQAGDYPWKQAYDILAADGKSQLTYMPNPFATVSRNPNVNLWPWRNDMVAAFFQSMMWYFTGNEAHAIKARDILMAWATTQIEFGGIESNLDLGDYAYAYGGAASILRGTWSGWTAANTAAVQNLFNNVYWPRTGCAGYALGPANKGTLSIAGGAAIAAFSDDPAKVAHIIHLMRYIGSTGFKNTLPSGEHGESGRDQGHSHGMWSGMAFTAEVLWKQGIDLYSELDNRLLALGEYFAKTNTGEPVGFVPFGTTDWYYFNAAPPGWDGGRWGLTLLHGAYNVRKKLGTPYISRRLTDIPGRFDPVYTWFYKSEDNSTAVVPPQTQFVPEPGKVGTGGLTSLDIGGATPAGSSSYNDNVWTVKGGGTDIWTHAADGLHFVYKEVTGNCSIIAKVESVGGTELNARAGLMIRSDLTATSAQRAWIAIKSGKRAEAFMHGWTEVRGGSNWERAERPIPQDSYWVKIERIGDVIDMYYSPDGTSWAAEVQGRFEGFTGKAYIGLAVCSNSNGFPMTATFSHVSVTGGQGGMVTTPEAPHSVYAYAGNNQVTVRWLSSSGAAGYTLKRSSSENGSYTTIASNLAGNSFIDNDVLNGQTYYYRVCAVNAAGTSADSPADVARPSAPYVPPVISSDVLNGVYRIIATHSGKVVEVKNGSTAEGALLGQKTYAHLSNQHWIISPLSGTDYKIINLLSGKAMDVVGNAITNGALIEQRSWSATDSAQVWSIKDRGNGTFSIVGKQSQKALNVPGFNTSDGVSMELNRWLDGTNQIYKIELVTASEMSAAYLEKLAEAIKLRDTTETSETNVPGKFPVAANAQLNDSITYVQSAYNAQSTVVEVSGYVTVLDNAIKRYKASRYYQMNTLADGYYYFKTLTSDSLFTRNETNTPLFDGVNSDPLLQIWEFKKQDNGRYKISCLSAPASFSNYLSEGAQFGRSVTPFSLVWNSMNIYFDGSSYAIQRAENGGNGYWYPSGRNIFTIGGSDNDPIPYSFPFRLGPVGIVPVNLKAAGGDGKNILDWDPIPNLTYDVKRSTTPGGPYTTIANISTTRYIDSVGVSNGTTYYYQVASPDSLAASPVVMASPNVGQVTYLKFDETSGPRAFDSWGARHGTLAGSATRSAGKFANSLKLDGSANAYATLPTGIVSTLNDFTISTWVKMDAIGNWMRVFDFGTGTTQYMFLTVQAGTNGVRYAIKNGGTEQTVSYNYTLPLNAWTHFTVTQSGNTASLYINGALVSSNTGVNIKPSQLTAAGTTTGTTLNYLGKSQFADPMFKGAIDEFKIYNRALTASEIAAAFLSQSITMNAIAPKLMGDADFDPAATASSGLPVTYTSSNQSVATIVDGKVHILSTGTTTITASQAGNDVYWPAPSQSKELSVSITQETQPTTLIGKPFSYTITNRPLSYFTATGLPAGLSVDAESGVISGTPTEYGTFPVVIGAFNDSIPGTQTITLIVQDTVINTVLVAAGDAKNILEWDAIQNFTYNVKRSTTSGGPYTTIANVSTNKFTDTAVNNGTTYYYVISLVDSAGEKSSSPEVVALPDTGQLTYLKFEETSGTRAIDSWGATHGTLAATATRAAGKYGTSLKLNGTAASYASLPAGIVNSLSDFTVSTWVKMDAIGNWMRVFDFGTGTTQYMFLTVQAGTTTVNGVTSSIVRYAIKNGGTELNVSSPYAFPLNTWVHLAVTQSGNTARLYINGTLVSTNTAINIKPSQLTTAGTTTGTTLNYLGKSQFNDQIFKGSIDEFKIYKRALSDAEIAENMKGGQTITFKALSQKQVGDDDFNAGAIATSGLPITYTSSDENVATIVNGIIHIVGRGATIITASQNGDNTYKAAVSVSRQLTVYQLPTVKTKNIQIAVDANGNATITPQQADDGSVSYAGALTLSLNRTDFTCSDIGSPVIVMLTATDADGHSGSATAEVTVVDDLKPTVTAPALQFFCYDQSGSYSIPSLTASDNCGIASISYTVSGATSRNGIGTDASGSFNAGQSTIAWTVTDVHGNVDTAATIVTVNAAMSAAIPDVYAMNPAVDAKNTIYIGYGPASLAITANASGGTAPYAYSWNNGQTSQSISVSAAGTYSVTVTDSKGCTTTASVVMSTLDVRCGNNNDKVMICHNNNTICVASASVQDHLDHGDHLGGCAAPVARVNTENSSMELSSGKVIVYPNPVKEEWNIQVSGVEAGSIVKMYDQNGVLVKTLLVKGTSEAISVHGLAAGMYYLQIKTRGVLITKKFVKL